MADRLAESEDVDMASADRSGQCSDGYDVTTIDELSAKFSVQGTSSSKSSGKKKVVCMYILRTGVICVYVLKYFNFGICEYICIYHNLGSTAHLSNFRRFNSINLCVGYMGDCLAEMSEIMNSVKKMLI